MKRILTLSIALVVLVGLSCERSTDPEGPSLNVLYGEFTVLEDFEVSSQNVNFSNGGSIFFEAFFSKPVEWKVTITGQNSGATKVIEGLSIEVDEKNSTWIGDITTLPMLKIEPCEVVLSVARENFADTLSINVQGVKSNDGFVVTDFESGLNDGFTRFVQSGVPPMIFDTVADASSAEGNVYYEMSGEVPFSDDLGNILMPKSAFTDTGFTLPPNDQVVYFNFFARKGPQVIDEILVFQFMEDDDGNGVYNAGADDLYEYVLDGLTEDWVHYSVLYADIVGAQLNGNQRRDPDKLIEMRLLPISPPPGRLRIQTFVDYMIYTENAPLQP